MHSETYAQRIKQRVGKSSLQKKSWWIVWTLEKVKIRTLPSLCVGCSLGLPSKSEVWKVRKRESRYGVKNRQAVLQSCEPVDLNSNEPSPLPLRTKGWTQAFTSSRQVLYWITKPFKCFCFQTGWLWTLFAAQARLEHAILLAPFPDNHAQLTMTILLPVYVLDVLNMVFISL